MKVSFTDRADKDYVALRPEVRKAFAKQLGFLLNQLGHPSLRAKKYDEANDIWQARVNRSWRFYFVIRGDEYVILIDNSAPKIAKASQNFLENTTLTISGAGGRRTITYPYTDGQSISSNCRNSERHQ